MRAAVELTSLGRGTLIVVNGVPVPHILLEIVRGQRGNSQQSGREESSRCTLGEHGVINSTNLVDDRSRVERLLDEVPQTGAGGAPAIGGS